MTLPRGARLETLFLTAAVLALAACGSSSGDGTPTCAGCEGALCRGTCTDLSDALASTVQAALPASACVPPSTSNLGLVTVCGGQTCGGGAGCTVDLAWEPISLSRATQRLDGILHASSHVDVSLAGGSSCTATVAADVSFTGSAAFACTDGSETATVGAITPTLTGSSVTPDPGCELYAAYLEVFRPIFEAAAESAAASALARAAGSVTATCR